jgi:hypothetical protein
LAIAFISSESAGSGNTNSVTTAALDTTSANLIVVAVSWHGSVSEGTLSDSQSNTGWDASTLATATSAMKAKLYFKAAPTTNASHTFTYTTSGGYPSIYVATFSGVHATPYTSQESSNTASANSGSPGAITPSENNCLLVSAYGYLEDVATLSIPTSGWTIAEQLQYVGGTYFGGAIAYNIQATAGSTNPVWTLSSLSSDMAMTMAVFKAAAGSSASSSVSSSASSSVSASTSAGGGLIIVARNVLDYDANF